MLKGRVFSSTGPFLGLRSGCEAPGGSQKRGWAARAEGGCCSGVRVLSLYQASLSHARPPGPVQSAHVPSSLIALRAGTPPCPGSSRPTQRHQHRARVESACSAPAPWTVPASEGQSVRSSGWDTCPSRTGRGPQAHHLCGRAGERAPHPGVTIFLPDVCRING